MFCWYGDILYFFSVRTTEISGNSTLSFRSNFFTHKKEAVIHPVGMGNCFLDYGDIWTTQKQAELPLSVCLSVCRKYIVKRHSLSTSFLFGGSAIREHFKGFEGKAVDVVSEEYYPVQLGETAAHVCGRIAVRNRHNQLGAVNCFTIGWRLIGGKLKLVHQHNSYEYTQPDIEGERGVLKMDMNTTQFVRNLLLEQPAGRRIAFPSGNQTVYVNPYTILYAQSRDKRTELVCVDRVVSCNYIYRELKERLPEVFYPLRRGYLVNTLYIVALRRFEAELISGISIPIPALTYTQVKRDLQELIEKK